MIMLLVGIVLFLLLGVITMMGIIGLGAGAVGIGKVLKLDKLIGKVFKALNRPVIRKNKQGGKNE